MMEANRWIELRIELNNMYLDMKNELGNPSAVEKYFRNLTKHYPELLASHEAEVKEIEEPKKVKIKQDMNEEEEEEEDVSKPKQKTKEEIKEILIKSLKNQDAFKDYQHVEVNTKTEQDCLNTLSFFNKAVTDARKRIIYFTSLQGEVLHKLREMTKCSMNDLIKKTDYSPSYVYFFLNLYKLVDEFNKLRHSDLRLSFFKSNMKVIREICKENRHQFIQ